MADDNDVGCGCGCITMILIVAGICASCGVLGYAIKFMHHGWSH